MISSLYMFNMSVIICIFQTDGSRLISVNDQSENTFVLSQLAQVDPGPTRYTCASVIQMIIGL